MEDSPQEVLNKMAGEIEGEVDPVCLSDSTQTALQEFLNKQRSQEEQCKKDPFAEDWGMSQFWYTQETANTVAREIIEASPEGRVACISCPTLFREFKTSFPNVHCTLLEYDARFKVLDNFVFYDYNQPLEVPEELKGTFDVVVADPPYLAEECLVKTLKTAKLLQKTGSRIMTLLLTGAVMKDVAQREANLRPVQFRPQHSSKLANEFLLYMNWTPSSRLGGWDNEK